MSLLDLKIWNPKQMPEKLIFWPTVVLPTITVFVFQASARAVDEVCAPLGCFLLGFLDPWRWDRKVVPKRRQETTTIRYIISQKSEDLNGGMYFSRTKFLRTPSNWQQISFSMHAASKQNHQHYLFWIIIRKQDLTLITKSRRIHIG
jgi:hypothetical protein